MIFLNKNIRITFLGTYEVLCWVKETLKEFGININSNILSKGKIFSFSITGNNTKNLIDWVKNKNIYCLERKIKKYAR